VWQDPHSVAAGVVQFSWPTYQSGMRIMFHSQVKVGSMWAYLTGFHWTIWMSLPATAVIIGLMIAVVEWVQCKSAELDNPQVVAKGECTRYVVRLAMMTSSQGVLPTAQDIWNHIHNAEGWMSD